jgi:hypothetical protein
LEFNSEMKFWKLEEKTWNSSGPLPGPLPRYAGPAQRGKPADWPMPAAPRGCPTGGDHALPPRRGAADTSRQRRPRWQDPHPHNWGATGRWSGKVLGGGDSPWGGATWGGRDGSERRYLTATGGLRWPVMCSEVSYSSREKRGVRRDWGGRTKGTGAQSSPGEGIVAAFASTTVALIVSQSTGVEWGSSECYGSAVWTVGRRNCAMGKEWGDGGTRQL